MMTAVDYTLVDYCCHMMLVVVGNVRVAVALAVHMVGNLFVVDNYSLSLLGNSSGHKSTNEAAHAHCSTHDKM